MKAVDPKSAEPSKPKVLIFGKPGVGKTWTALDFPNVYFIDTEGGADLPHYTDKLSTSGGVYLGLDQGSANFSDVIEQIKALATEEHTYKTVVIDSVTKIFNNEVAREAERLLAEGKKNEFSIDKKPALALLKQLISWIQRLDMNVIMIAHEKSQWGLNDKKERVETGVTFDFHDKVEYELHLCLNIAKQGASRKARVTKTRLTGFPDAAIFDWSYDNFAERYGREVLERSGKTLVLATADQLEKLKSYLEVVKLAEGQTDKWLAHYSITSFEEMDSSSLEKILTHLRDKSTIKG